MLTIFLRGFILSLCVCSLLLGCSSETSQSQTNRKDNSDNNATENLPIAIGTDISTLKKEENALAGSLELNVDDIQGDTTSTNSPTDATTLLDRRKSEEEMAASAPDNPIEITWDQLLPEDYSPEAVFSKFQTEIANLNDSDPRAEEIYKSILEEINNAPANTKLDGKWVKLPGFIAPLTYDEEVIPEFLLVPYFGACIHTPPPPTNQIVLTHTKKDEALPLEDAYFPIWVIGQITLDTHATDLGTASYSIKNASIEKYEDY